MIYDIRTQLEKVQECIVYAGGRFVRQAELENWSIRQLLEELIAQDIQLKITIEDLRDPVEDEIPF